MQADGIEQCKHDAYLEAVKEMKGEGCRVWGTLQVNKVVSPWVRMGCRLYGWWACVGGGGTLAHVLVRPGACVRMQACTYWPPHTGLRYRPTETVYPHRLAHPPS